jgi:DNA invertase Pin-like site-specific DNA recombinase
MSEIVDRVARVIYEANRDAADSSRPPARNQRPFDDLHSLHREAIKEIARAAIAAMREPTREMVAALELIYVNSGQSSGSRARRSKNFNLGFNGYQSMIDEALKQMTTYGYLRTSTLEQTQNGRTTLADQERMVRGVAMMRGIDPAEMIMIVDVGISGGILLRDRPEGGRLYAGLEAGDEIIAAKLDRVFRSASDALVTSEVLKKRGVALLLAEIGPDPLTDNGISKLYFTILAAFAEFEKTRIAERMSEGRKGKLARGGHIGGLAPYGWRVEGAGRDARLIEDAAERGVILRARELRRGGMSLRVISRQLALEGKLARDGREFQSTQVLRMVKGVDSGDIVSS